ncbi:MAG: hypothetical protein E7319_09105 [Clostridiales bacterium]|nr:hypothetical protein [Clostridiales bacterium]
MKDALMQAPWLRAMARVFEAAEMPLYIVGGAVRNPLMGLPISDVDICGPALPEQVCALCEGTPVRAHLRAAHFGTVELHITDDNGQRHMAEYTTFREDSYRCGHKPEAVRFTTQISVDCLRRDFSVNALYRRVYPDRLGDVIDPTGGLTHMQQGILHTVTLDPDQVLKDDGLRILRAARFQAEMDLVPTPALMDSLTRYAPLLGDIAPERLRDEWQKVLLADLRYPQLNRRSPATQSGLATIRRIGAWPYVMDGLACEPDTAPCLLSIPASALPAAEEAIAPLPLRMAVLCANHAPQQVEERMLTLHFSNRDAAQTAAVIRLMSALKAQTATIEETALAGLPVLDAAIRGLNALRLPDAAAYGTALCQRLTQPGIPLSLRQLAVNGNDLMPLVHAAGQPARCMGALLNALWQEAVNSRLPNQREALLAHAQKLLASMPEPTA